MKQETLQILNDLVRRYPVLNSCRGSILDAATTIINAFKNGKKLLICGNGGSASDSAHIVGELLKNFKIKRKLPENLKENLGNDEIFEGLEKGYPVIDLTANTAFMTAYMNDHNPDFVFAQQVNVYGESADVLLLISTSGNSKNCLYAAEVARAKLVTTISLTGKYGGELANRSYITIKAPETETYKVQELHLPIYHCLCAMIEMELE